MSEPTPAKKRGGWMKGVLIGLLGVGGGAAGTYATAIVDRIAKPTKPVANFSVSIDGLTVTCQNHASGESGWWDFGDGTALEPFVADTPVSHTYAKPGNYTVKLTVRNYVADENDRAVPVEVGSSAVKDASAPRITGFIVAPVGSHSMAPATFRITAEVANAEHCVWDFGDGRVEVGEGGKIDRLVSFEKPGTFAVQLLAHNGKQATKQSASAKVEAAPTGTLMAVLKVTDTGNRVVQLPRTESIAIPVPAGKTPPPGFSKVVQARPGFTLIEATPNPAAVAGVKNLRLAIAADKRSVTVSGEWAGDSKATNRAAGGSDAIIAMKLVEERVVPVPPAVTLVTGTLTASTIPGEARTELPLPPVVAGQTREYQLEIRQTAANGQAVIVARSPADGKGSVAFPWRSHIPSASYTFGATLGTGNVVVTGISGK